MRLIDLSETLRKVRYRRSKTLQLIKENRFPQPIKLGKSIAFVESEIDQWISDRIADSRKETVRA